MQVLTEVQPCWCFGIQEQDVPRLQLSEDFLSVATPPKGGYAVDKVPEVVKVVVCLLKVPCDWVCGITVDDCSTVL